MRGSFYALNQHYQFAGQCQLQILKTAIRGKVVQTCAENIEANKLLKIVFKASKKGRTGIN